MVANALRLVGGGRGAVVKAYYLFLIILNINVKYRHTMRYVPTVMSVDPDVVPPEMMVAWQV